MDHQYFYSEDVTAIYDIYALFKYYNQFFFQGILQKCTIQWSKKMTLCAGTCENKGLGSCCIKLSEPLLKFRTPNQLKQTILHEMIHAYLFITNPQACLTQGGHGKQFKQIMNNINKITSLRVTVFHSFTDQVQSYRTHVWRCNGICKDKAPHYGYVKRAMNRKPQPADPWFKDHQRYCGGQFIKISEPEETKKTTLKNGKTLKTNIKLDGQQPAIKGKGKTLQDYVKQMQQKQKKVQKGMNRNQNNSFRENQFQYFQGNNERQKQKIQRSNPSQKRQKQQNNQKQKRKTQAQKEKKQKSRPKQKKQQKNTPKITQWFRSSGSGRTIQQYSKQLQEEDLMSTMRFNR